MQPKVRAGLVVAAWLNVFALSWAILLGYAPNLVVGASLLVLNVLAAAIITGGGVGDRGRSR